MKLRHVIAGLLIADTTDENGTLAELLVGGIYPTGTSDALDVTAISKTTTPGAYDDADDVLPCAVVAEENAIPFGPIPLGQLGIVRVWLYQQRGRDAIETAQRRIAVLLDRERIVVEGRYRTLRFAGFGPSGVKDSALRDASVSWVRFQATGLIALPS